MNLKSFAEKSLSTYVEGWLANDLQICKKYVSERFREPFLIDQNFTLGSEAWESITNEISLCCKNGLIISLVTDLEIRLD